MPARRTRSQGDDPLHVEPLLSRLCRRVVSIPVVFTVWALSILLSPFLLPIGLVLDGVARRWKLPRIRAYCFGVLYLTCEVAGIAVFAWLWLRVRDRGERWTAAHFRLESWWARTIFWGGVRLHGIRVEVEGDDALDGGPALYFVRHVSPVDNLIPAVVIGARHGVRLRWVMTRALRRDPCIDMVGSRLPACFVASGAEAAREIGRVRMLAHDLGPRDGVLIYPEGTLFTAERQQRLRERSQRSDDPLDRRSAAFRHILPPRFGGSLALLDEATTADAVFVAHTGLEASTSYQSMADGSLIGAVLRIAAWRIPAGEIPESREERTAWLLDQWLRVDAWIDAARRPH